MTLKRWLAFANHLYITLKSFICQGFLHKNMGSPCGQQAQKVREKIRRSGNQHAKAGAPGKIARLEITVATADAAKEDKAPDKNQRSSSIFSARKHNNTFLYNN